MGFLEVLVERYGEAHYLSPREFNAVEINALLESRKYPVIVLDIAMENQVSLKKINRDPAYRHIVSFRFGFYLLILKDTT